MPTTSISLRHRPLRIGFLVRPDELQDLRKAAGLCTLLWGGIHNPLIPVSAPDDAFAHQLISLFQVDVLYPVESSEAIDRFVEKHPFLRLADVWSG
jgi:hypothetical protein